MRHFVVFALVPLLAARAASANQCPAYGTHVVTTELPLGCPLVLYKDHVWTPDVPNAGLTRGGMSTEVTPTVIASEAVELNIYMETIDANCVEFRGYETRVWDRVTVDYGPVQVGDTITPYGDTNNATIVEAGACPTPGLPDEYVLYCSSPVQDYAACEHGGGCPGCGDPGNWGDDTAGCNAGGSLGLAAIALLGGLRRRRTGERS